MRPPRQPKPPAPRNPSAAAAGSALPPPPRRPRLLAAPPPRSRRRPVPPPRRRIPSPSSLPAPPESPPTSPDPDPEVAATAAGLCRLIAQFFYKNRARFFIRPVLFFAGLVYLANPVRSFVLMNAFVGLVLLTNVRYLNCSSFLF